MAENKTQPTEVDPAAFIAAVEHPTRRADAEVLLGLMTRWSGYEPRMWGPSIIGYGRYRYRYDSGREGEYFVTGFSPRKANLVVYLPGGYDDLAEPLARLGKHKLGNSCLYLNSLAAVDQAALEEIVKAGVTHMQDHYETFDH